MVDILIIGGIVLASVALGLFVVPFLQRKGVLTEKNVQNTSAILEVTELIVKNVTKDEQTKNKAETIFNVAEVAVRYVEQTMKDQSNLEKKASAKEAVLETLKQLDIVLTDDEMKIVDIAIESAVNLLPKTNK